MIKYFIQPPGAETVDRIFFGKRDKFERVKRPEDCDMLILTGGIDIHPGLYGEEPIFKTDWYSKDRDKAEWEAIQRSGNAFKFGICRGGQLLNIFNGGTLWQHVDNHEGGHLIYDRIAKKRIITSSVHHQQFRVTDKALIIATCNMAKRKLAEKDYHHVGEDGPDDDVEICYYPSTRALCIQGHPEYGPDTFTRYCFELIDRYYEFKEPDYAI